MTDAASPRPEDPDGTVDPHGTAARTSRATSSSGWRRLAAAVAGLAVIGLVAGGIALSTSPDAPREAPTDSLPHDSILDAWTLRASNSARGAAPLGSRVPDPPAGAVYVAARDGTTTGGGDGGTGSADGSAERPYPTIAAALAATGDGATIVLREGTYHEQVFVTDSADDPHADVTIQAYPGEEVWLDGSRELRVRDEGGRAVAPWRDGPTWNDYESYGDHDETGDLAVVGDQNPVAADPTEVWVDGRRLWQVEANPGPGQFAVERAQRRTAQDDDEALIVLGERPAADAEVRASYLGQAVVAHAPGVTLLGFGVRGYATPINWMGTVYLQGESPVVRDVVLRDLPSNALFVSDSAGAVVENVTVTSPGLTGIAAVHSDGAAFRHNVIRGANHQLFNPAPIAGGMKVGQMSGFTIEDTLVAGTHNATGLWVDESGVDFTLADNLVVDSGYSGIVVEISGRGLVAGNTVLSSDESGVVVYSSEDVTVANNVVADSGARGGVTGSVVVLQDGRRAADGGMGVDTRGAARELTWRTSGVTVSGNVLALPDPAAQGQLVALDHTGRLSADDMGISVRNNVLVGPVPTSTGGSAVPLAAWRDDRVESLAGPQDVADRLGDRWADNAVLPAQSDPASLDAEVRRASRDVAAPVDGDLARVLGVAPGTTLLGPPGVVAP